MSGGVLAAGVAYDEGLLSKKMTKKEKVQSMVDEIKAQDALVRFKLLNEPQE